MYGSDWILLMIVSTVLGLVTQGYVNSTFKKWSRIPIATGESGAQVAQRILRSEGLGNVAIQPVAGNLTDHYDPRSKKLGLSQQVYAGTSVAAAGVAAHETGHAIQDARAYAWNGVRTALVPAANLGSQLSWVLIFLGLFINLSGLFWLGIGLYAAAVLFTIVTLPVEFDASRRALVQLQTTAMLPPEQVAGARSVLTAAALTYVAAALIAALQLIYLLGLARDR